ncbi:MAG: tetratricopeptide repeat protein [Terriglobia bacterium]
MLIFAANLSSVAKISQQAPSPNPAAVFAHAQQALAEFNQEITASPGEPWSYQSEGYLDYKMGHIPQAIQMYRKALSLDAKLPDSLAGLGRADAHSGKSEEGVQYLKRASDLEPDSASIRYQLGRAYLKSGDRADAQRQFASAQKLQANTRERETMRLRGGLPMLENSGADQARAQSPRPSRTPALHGLPTSAAPRARYVGSQACAQCHASEAATQALTPMAHALERPANSALLREHPGMTFRNGPYLYKIRREGSRSVFIVTDGRRAISVPILWAFGYGIGGVGQTYVFRYGGYYFERQVSYYEGIQRLGITMGHTVYPPASLGAALGYPLSDAAVRKCFACHATGAVRGNQLELDKMIPGVSCEACHGPGSRHIAAVQSGNLSSLQIFNPGRLSTGEITAFCGSCHRTAAQERLLQVRGVQNVRFQGYRLERSRCYNPSDSRISCIACHNPHRAVVTSAAYYDAKCLACHARTGAATMGHAPACPVATRNCVVCHMPKVEVPGVYHKFTDHFIRVVKANRPYPS